jgi:hypothetical protein
MTRVTRLVVSSVVASVLVAFAGAPAYAQGMASGDFNGDGHRDLAVGVPDEDVIARGVLVADAGAVHVLYGGASAGLTATGNELLYQGGPDILELAEKDDRFGYALAAGDFNGDGYDDLAVGVPGQSVGGDAGAGAVHVFRGSLEGLVRVVAGVTIVADAVWNRDSASVLDTADPGDNFGGALTAGDFNGDTCDDLAIGVPFDDVAQASDAGSIHVLHGSTNGLVAADLATTGVVNEDDRVWHQDAGTISTVSEPGDRFGWVVAAGDFNGDGECDLAIGIPGESVGTGVEPDPSAGPQNAGAVLVLEGSSAGLTDIGNEAWHQARPNLAGLPDTAEAGDGFGYALAVGDFNGDGCDDLAIGVPFEDYEFFTAVFPDTGAIHVLYGDPAGELQYGTDQIWDQDAATADGVVSDAREPGDAFGFSLAAGDLNGDGFADLTVGVPYEDLATFDRASTNAGAMHVFYGRANDGVALAGTQFWHQDSPSVTDTTESGDLFSMSLAVGDFNGDGSADVAVGVPGEGVTAGGAFREHAGAVNVLHGAIAGLRASDDAGTVGIDEDDQFWHQDSANVADGNDVHDHFGGGRATP